MNVSAISLLIELMIHEQTILLMHFHFLLADSSVGSAIDPLINPSLFFAVNARLTYRLQIKKFVFVSGTVTKAIPGLSEFCISSGSSGFWLEFDLLSTLDSPKSSIVPLLIQSRKVSKQLFDRCLL